MSQQQRILEIERHSDLLDILHILKNEDNTFTEMSNKFLEVLSPILGYYHAQNQCYVKKTENS